MPITNQQAPLTDAHLMQISLHYYRKKEKMSELVHIPDYLKNLGTEGTEGLQDYIKPARLKVVQATASKNFADQFATGDIVAVPLMVKLASLKESIPFVPLFFYAEWICWNPLETRGTLPGIRERSLDPKSTLAIKSRNFDKRASEPCPEMPTKDNKQLVLKYLEHLNFVVMLLQPTPLPAMPVVLTFSSGEHRSGSNFAALIKTRNAPIYACQFQATVRRRDGQKGTWYGVDCENPTTVKPFVETVEEVERNRVMYQELKKAYDNQAIIVEMDDGDAFDGEAKSPEIDC